MQKQDFLEILKNYRDLISPTVIKYVTDSLKFPKYCQIETKYQNLINFQENLILEYPKRLGKYLRPTLLMSTALAMGTTKEEAILGAAAMQLSEEWILIHDDIEDDSEQRRGLPTLQKIYGVPLAINAGDALQVIMWKMIGDIDNKKIFEEFYQLLNRTTLGQTIDIKWNQENKMDITDDDVYLILESKTCYYTISGPMRLGAIMAGANNQELDIIYKFGLNLGRSFQIIDDILDITTDFAGQKKQKYNDIYEGKRTIPLSHLLKRASSDESIEITNILAKSRNEKTEEEVLRIIELMKKYKSIESAKELAIKFSQEAKAILKNEMPFIRVSPYREQLESAIDFIVNRDH